MDWFRRNNSTTSSTSGLGLRNMIRQTVETVKLNSSVWKSSAFELAQVIRNLVYHELDQGVPITLVGLHNALNKTHAANIHMLGIFRLVSFQRFMRIAVAGVGIRSSDDESCDGTLYKVPVPTKDELLTHIIDWRTRATGLSIGIDDLELELTTKYFCEFSAFGFGRLNDFLTENGFIMMEVHKTIFFRQSHLHVPHLHQQRQQQHQRQQRPINQIRKYRQTEMNA